tara:strand:- start:127 stop:1197 length:1071 start_codon:yes stop_codon:yes gene_type:complete
MGKVLEVIDTSAAYTNNPLTKWGKRLPLGSVKVRSSGGNKNLKDEWAVPLGPIKRIPLVGEHVITLKGPTWSNDPGQNPQRPYYLTSCNVQDNLNIGVLPQTFLRGRSGPIGQLGNFINYLGVPQLALPINPFVGQTFQERSNVKPVQPYEGDTIFEGRFGQTIRFGSTVTKSPHRDAIKGIDIYEIKACKDWEGGTFGQGSPITFITNGHFPVPGPARYTKEDLKKDSATICMTSGQKIKTFSTAQPNLGLGVLKSNKSAVAQIILNSDRLVFNAKTEHVILVAKKSVQIATPDWAADMNEVLTIMDEFLKIMQKITSASSPYPTAPGLGNGPTLANPAAGQVAALVQRMTQLKQ